MFKKTIICLVCAAFLSASTGCFGSFTLTKKVYDWNESVGDKWIQTIVMWVFDIVPVYGACVFIDVVVLNLIEFWTGSNPIALNADTPTEKTFENDGKTYNVTIGKGNITIRETQGPDAGKQVTLTLDKKSASWYLSDGTTRQLVATLNPQPLNTIDLYYPDGRVVSKNMAMPQTAALVQ